MEIDKYFGGILLGGLCILAFLSLFISLYVSNNYNNNNQDEEITNYVTSLNTNLSAAYSDYNSSSEAFASEDPLISSGYILFQSIAGMWKTLRKAPGEVINLTFGLIKGKLLSDAVFNVVFGVIMSVFILTLIVVVVRFIRT
jgi:hypothetical protein